MLDPIHYLAVFFILVIAYFIYINYNIESFSNGNNKKLSLVPRLYSEACDQLKIPYQITDLARGQLIIDDGKKKIFIAQLYNTFNSNQAIKLARDKYKTFLLLNRHKIPVPQAQLLENIQNRDPYKIMAEIKIPFPLVIKQVSGANGDHVYVDIRDREGIIKTLSKLISGRRSNVIVEKFITGSDYRVLVFNHQVLDVIHRPKPFIIGDGHHTIQELVSRKNMENSSLGVHAVIIDHDYLMDRRIRTTDIPVRGQKLIVNPLTNFHQGSTPQRIKISDIHPDNIKLFIEISKIMRLQYTGIDFLSPDIRKSYLDPSNRSAVNEINGLPNLDIHYYADRKNNNEVVVNILKSYFKS